MSSIIPSSDEVRSRLRALKPAELQALANASGVPFTTLLKVRDGVTQNPRLETVRQFYPHLPASVEQPA